MKRSLRLIVFWVHRENKKLLRIHNYILCCNQRIKPLSRLRKTFIHILYVLKNLQRLRPLNSSITLEMFAYVWQRLPEKPSI